MVKDPKVLCDLYLVCNWKTLSSNYFFFWCQFQFFWKGSLSFYLLLLSLLFNLISTAVLWGPTLPYIFVIQQCVMIAKRKDVTIVLIWHQFYSLSAVKTHTTSEATFLCSTHLWPQLTYFSLSRSRFSLRGHVVGCEHLFPVCVLTQSRSITSFT